jgi:hypothetical protein
MTASEFAVHRENRPCGSCGVVGVVTQLNPNNNGLLVLCPNCGSKRPWGSLLFLKQNAGKRLPRAPLPDGQTLDSVWEQYGDRCVFCSAPKSFLLGVGIGRHVHHVAPFAEEGHRGPVVPICAHCHEVANARQRIYWFLQRVVLKPAESGSGDRVEAARVSAPPARSENSAA